MEKFWDGFTSVWNPNFIGFLAGLIILAIFLLGLSFAVLKLLA